ncbi:MAG TPA: hypothetical protein VFD59_15400 [Nocardioidaceae bacterium]|nr:hypothetical protein [Nocardioidaceae bacterium]
MNLAKVAEELYALTPTEFIGTRNERAKEAKPDDRTLSTAIGKLPKPSTAAWLVNMLVRHLAAELEQLLTVGSALREAQANLDGAELRELNKQRRQLTTAVTNQGRGLAAELGVQVSDTVATQVEETLRAAMTDEGATRAVRTGQLVQALSATGVGELDVSTAVAVPEALGMTARRVERKKPALTVVPDESGPESDEGALRAAAEEARRSAEAAEEAAAKAHQKLGKAHKRVAKLEARSLQLQGELEEVRRRGGELEHALESLDDELASAEEKRDRAMENEASAKATAEQSRGAAQRLDGE